LRLGWLLDGVAASHVAPRRGEQTPIDLGKAS
jgi:hypothetical protein